MDASLSETLQKIGLADVEDKLSELGVTEAKDVLELEKEDLQGAGLTLVQIRKLQNAVKGKAPAAVAKKAAVVEQAAAECPSGHSLKKVISDGALYQCDGCSKKLSKGQAVYCCRECNYDVCTKCAGVPETNGHIAAGGGGKAGGQEKRYDPTDGKGPFTYASFLKYHGVLGLSLWEQAGQDPSNIVGGGGYSNGGGMIQKKRKPPPTTPFKRKFLEFAEGDFDAAAADIAREELQLSIDGGPEEADGHHPPMSTFEEMTDLPAYCLEALNKMDIHTPMPIQAQAIPIVLSGNDLVGVAKTGSGKTLAYLIPAVIHIEAQEPIAADDLSPIVVCLAPTRELAVQIQEEADKLLSCSKDAEGSNHPDGLKACCIYGGMKKDGQIRNALGAQIMAATPGRLHEHVMKDDISMDRVTYFVLDEGDRMLEEGFESQVKVIANAIRPDRHMLFFSATWPMQVHRLAKVMCKGSKPPVRLRVGQNSDGTARTRDDIQQTVIVFDGADWEERDREKKKTLYERTKEALELGDTKVLVFVGRKDLAEEMSYNFNGQGFESEAMHGGKTQDAREAVLERFKNKETRLLVTTDVMGRGLDIPSITHVMVYDMGDIEDYVHRIGRTARGPHGEGQALTLFEYDPRWPHIAEGLIKCLEQSNQEIPEELRTIAEEVKEGKREIKSMKGRYGGMSGNQGSYSDIEKKKYGGGANGKNLLASW